VPSVESATKILDALKHAGISLVASVPDAALAKLCDGLEESNEFIHVPLTREEEGVGVCTGGYLSGRRCALMMQNAGFLNACNSLTTTALQAEIPMVLLILYAGYRGDPAFPQLGLVTEPVLEALRIPHYIVNKIGDVDEIVTGAVIQAYNAKRPVAVLLAKAVL
jgi:sulfopyruvate decarboxylase subunit alpha